MSAYLRFPILIFYVNFSMLQNLVIKQTNKKKRLKILTQCFLILKHLYHNLIILIAF